MSDEKTNETRDVDRVEDSARKLYLRLNPEVRDREIAADAPSLPVYDWEIAKDAEIEIDDVRTALRSLEGGALALETVSSELIVISLTQTPVDNAA